MDFQNSSNQFEIEANYLDSFAKIKQDSRSGEDPFNVGLVRFECNDVILDEKTPKELEMEDQTNIIFFTTRTINIKLVNAVNLSTITDICVKDKYPLDYVIKQCAKIAGVELDSAKFTYRGYPIHPGNTPKDLSMEENATVKLQERVVEMKLKFVGSFNVSETVVLTISVKYDCDMDLAKKEYAALVGEDVNKLRFMFKEVAIWKDETPEFLQDYFGLKEMDIIKVVDQNYDIVNIRTLNDVSFGRIRHYYANRIGKPVANQILLYHGQLVSDEETPASLEMKKDDIIEVYAEKAPA